jgi:hypothetical protein
VSLRAAELITAIDQQAVGDVFADAVAALDPHPARETAFAAPGDCTNMQRRSTGRPRAALASADL